ncbi:NAD(P)-dependent oxidoreductase [Plantactinospora siamensis]|uniref:NAD(P)-dependent oxidoreductase n=1 Tax=Plantactinospora siamensis TaxID=555372 RepID=A0ABV6NYT1_9ACTN
MNLTVLGSTGRTGRLVVAEGLRRGHRITAFTRRPDALPAAPAPTRVVTGDGRDRAAVGAAVIGADAVIAVIGGTGRRGPHHTAAVAGVLAACMSENGVRRLAITSAYPIVAVRPRLAMALLRWLLADAYADVARMERIVSAADLDWTIVRLNRLTDGPPRGRPRISRDLLDRPSPITRADAAGVLLNTVEDGALGRTAINIAGS